MSRLLLLLLLSLTAFAETPLGVVQHGPATDVQFGSTLASDGDGYLAVWTDRRSREIEMRATRLDADGTVLDPTGIHLFTAPVYDPVAIWTGTSYLVAWGTQQDNKLWIARIDRDGAIVDGPRVLVQNARPYSLARDATHVVLGYNRADERHPRALFLRPDGRTVANLSLIDDGQVHRGPRLVSSGSGFAALWTTFEPGAIDGVRFSLAGVETPRRIVSDSFFYDPEIASDGTDYVLVSREDWLAGRHATRSVSADLATIGTPAVLPEELYSNVTIGWTGVHYAVVGDFGAPLSGVRVGRDGRPLDAKAIAIESAPQAGSAAAPSIASNGRGVLVSWSGSFAYNEITSLDVFATRVDPATLAHESRALLSVSAPREETPVLATGRANVLAVWRDDLGLAARRLHKDGSPLDAVPLRLTDKNVIPTVVFNGTDYLVAWREGMELVTRRVPHDGALRADGGGRGSGGDFKMAAASNGTTTLLVWGGGGLHAVRLGGDGSVLDRFTPLTIVDKQIGRVDVAADDRGQFLVTWDELEVVEPYYETYTPVRVRGARVTASLQNLDGRGFDIANTAELEGEPAVTWNGREWLVIWTEAKTRLRARKVTSSGTLSGADLLVALHASRPDVAWDGSRYAVSWLRPGALMAAWLTGDTLFGERPLGTPEVWPPASPTLAVVGVGEVLAGYARIAREPAHGGVARAFVETLRFATRKRRGVR
ncbi:MAG TPA: hypothetical protein VEO54_30650 [Thermoanaerobaculia bacterium]|nr:hypothetical protein [Thermoanaerobaculia bacterium]